ncbi:hypothetical protein [Saccharopolyspora griseoalba]|uniref:Uncharacterized protein n=1 Tax=Saccharopolyspora griseoalba TaxID=1431848 RepID=A0ABW2LHB3_9PSEU
MNARIDLAISAGLAEPTSEAVRDHACECAPARPGIRQQLAALFAPLTTARLGCGERTAPQER